MLDVPRDREEAVRQLSLLDVVELPGVAVEPLPPHNGVETSREAAEAIKGHVTEQEAVVLAAVAAAAPAGNQGGLTCDEAEVITGLSHQSCSARFRGLAKAGRIVELRDQDGEVVKRPTRSLRRTRAIVWVAVAREVARPTERFPVEEIR
jgi:hypothetical protein